MDSNGNNLDKTPWPKNQKGSKFSVNSKTVNAVVSWLQKFQMKTRVMRVCRKKA